MSEAVNGQAHIASSPDEENGETAARQAETVVSNDGTSIGYWRTGEGPPLVLVHGTSADHTRWDPVLPALEEHFTVYAVDRRRRGGSGDTADHYSLEREVEDVVAIVDSIGAPVSLLGHSYGAICSLEASLLRTTHVHRLVLYEPPIPTSIEIFPTGTIARIEALIEAGDREEAVVVFLREVVKMPPGELDLTREASSWRGRVATAHTLPREMRAVEGYTFDPTRFRTLRTPTVLLVGGDSPPFLKAAIEAVGAALPDSRIVVMPGQQHVAMHTAPELFASLVVRFLVPG